MKVSQMMADIPEINELDINPLFANDQGVLALDARMRIKPATAAGEMRLAIRPYPKDLEEEVGFDGRQLLLRPIRPEDEPQYRAFFEKLDQEDVRFRFFTYLRQLPHSELARYTQIDFDREMAFIAAGVKEQGGEEILGIVRSVTDPDNQQAEFAIIVRSDLKGKGLGHLLLEKMIGYCRGRGTEMVVGEVLRDNYRMLALARKLGFKVRAMGDAETMEVRLDLQLQTSEASS
jgi:acetyltransferase